MAVPPLAEQGRAPGDGEVVRLAARAFERDRYLAALLAPGAVRESLVVLAAFAGEIGRIPGYVSDPMLGEIRLQWWRDAIEGMAAGGSAATGHPIADALGLVLHRHKLEVPLLLDLVDAQAARLDDQPFPDLAALLDNLARWDGALFRLAWRILDGTQPMIDMDSTVPPLLTAAARAYGLARLLSELPAELAQGRCRLPADMLAAHGLSLDAATSDASRPHWQPLEAEISTLAGAALEIVASSYQVAPLPQRCATLPVALVRPYLRACERSEIAALQMREIGPLTRVWRLWAAHRTGRV